MSNQNEHTRVDLLASDEHERYLVHGRREIHQILQGLIDGRALVTAMIAPGPQSFLTAVVAVGEDDQWIILDASGDSHINQRVGMAERLVCVTQLDKIRIQFALSNPANVSHQGRPAVRAPMPDEVLRLQRREYYRLQTPVTHSVTCHIPLRGVDGKARTMEVRVLDISGGGVAVIVPPDDLPMAKDMEFPDCQLHLPEAGPLTVRLKVRNLFRLTNRNGISMLRAGCEFLDLPRNADAAIQRYILKVERERSAREHGRL